MKFTLRDLIWATLVVALLLALYLNWIAFQSRQRLSEVELQKQTQRAETERQISEAYKARVDALQEYIYAISPTVLGKGKSLGARFIYGKQIQLSIDARCILIFDGDTIECLDDENNKFRVRLESIDCPKRNEPFSNKAKDFTGQLCHEKTVTLHVTRKDRYGRTLAFVEVGGKNLSVELLKAGLAKHFKKYSHDETLARYEAAAKKEKVGIWGE